ncbi:MAG: M20/M25/M40 family metallo-hydrolase [Desulfobacterales bacterium]|nr:M20/M25/M40 family metallo-hydrolase [Desulfobacterales bacterium]MDD4071520.1 M20/M25/M40 family metallo-hydrolase [Desulfobacterales bacterium]MDD4391806.1 M20/M25/M40 family metallo-hydrolase [Desulfobacterales bacterium]
MINSDRLADTFKSLAEIDSVSTQEKDIRIKIQNLFDAMGAETLVDDSMAETGSNTGNLIVKFKGNRPVPAMMFNAHMDTVDPGRGVKVLFNDGVFTSDGTTILGGDDKSAIAILIEVMRTIRERDLPHGPIELVFTVCEEIGLSGAKHLDTHLLNSTFGYSLDAADTEAVVTRAPAANRIDFKIHGKDAHAGSSPENGINAIVVASRAIAAIPRLGRIDSETTCNIGVVHGGIASNIVPNLVTVEGEARSHNQEKLDAITQEIVSTVTKVVEEEKKRFPGMALPAVEFEIESEFPVQHIPDDHPVVELARKAGQNLQRSIRTKTTGGGTDANIFTQKGIVMGVLGTGMTDVHTVRESVKLDDMVRSAELVMEIIRIHSGKEA